MSLFGTDGIRGTVGVWPLVPRFFQDLGASVGVQLCKGDRNAVVLIGRDTRESGQMLQSSLISGLLASGIDVVDLGVITTPGVAWLVKKMQATTGIVISASHNPVEQNGVKFFGPGGQKMDQEIEKGIEDLLSANRESELWKEALKDRKGQLHDGKDLQAIYIQDLLVEHPSKYLKGVTIVLDCANGAASSIAPIVFSRAGAEVFPVNASPTGLNINLSAGSEHVRRQPWDLGELVSKYNADFGVAFDGDADRVVFVDDKGDLVDGDHMLGILASYFSQNNQLLAQSVVTTVMRNEGLRNFVETRGLSMFETQVGDKYVVEKLFDLKVFVKDKGQIGLGGEQSGHIIIDDGLHATGDGIRTALYLMKVYVQKGFTSMAALADGIGKTPQVIASADVGVNDPRFQKFELEELTNKFLGKHPGLTRINLRYSGTEPKFRVMLEAGVDYSVNDLAEIAWALCKKAQKYAGNEGGSVDILNCTKGGVITISD